MEVCLGPESPVSTPCPGPVAAMQCVLVLRTAWLCVLVLSWLCVLVESMSLVPWSLVLSRQFFLVLKVPQHYVQVLVVSHSCVLVLRML